MRNVPLVVKWGKESLLVDFSLEIGVKGLKAQLEDSTGIPADRMKLMAKSKGGLCCLALAYVPFVVVTTMSYFHCTLYSCEQLRLG